MSTPTQPREAGRQRALNPATRWAILALGLLLFAGATLNITLMYRAGAPGWPSHDLSGTHDPGDATTLVVNSGESNVTIAEGDGDPIAWTAVTNSDPRTLEDQVLRAQGDTITLDMMNGTQWFGWLAMNGLFMDHQTLDVTVPANWVADLQLNNDAGEARIGGTWGDVNVRAGVGLVSLDVTTESLTVSLGLGLIEGTISDMTGPAVIDGGVGEADLRFAGESLPSDISVDAGVGNITLRLPATTAGYVVEHDGGIGQLSNRLPPADPNGIEVAGPVPVRVDNGVGDVSLLPTG